MIFIVTCVSEVHMFLFLLVIPVVEFQKMADG